LASTVGEDDEAEDRGRRVYALSPAERIPLVAERIVERVIERIVVRAERHKATQRRKGIRKRPRSRPQALSAHR